MSDPISDLQESYVGNNRANSMGEALENYVKDIFCGVSNGDNETQRERLYEMHLSYQGSQNNPPDFMIKQGDAVEVKKLTTFASTIQLNSSFPKEKLHIEDPRINAACRECENWTDRDILYVIGIVTKSTMKNLCFAYGDCFVATSDVYAEVHASVASAISNLDGLNLGITQELGRIEEVDQLKHTSLRIRGMWIIDNPIGVFDFAIQPPNESFVVNAIMLKHKFLSFPIEDQIALHEIDSVQIEERSIPSPNNPELLLEAVVIRCILSL